MAHFYDCPNVAAPADDVEGKGLQSLDTVTRKALIRFWVSVAVIVAAAAIFYLLSRNVLMTAASLGGALAAASAGIVSLYVLDRSVKTIHLVSPEQAKADHRVVLALKQLDDRFAVINGVREGSAWIDHLVVGPSGIYAITTSMLRQQRQLPVKADVAQVKEASRAIQKLVRRLLPQCSLMVEPVLCVVGTGKSMVRQENHGVWLVTLDKIVSALLRRSGQEGSISKNVDITGAFSADLAQVRALEQAFASHWELPKRPMVTDFMPSIASRNGADSSGNGRSASALNRRLEQRPSCAGGQTSAAGG